jgi:hypothetical protein
MPFLLRVGRSLSQEPAAASPIGHQADVLRFAGRRYFQPSRMHVRRRSATDFAFILLMTKARWISTVLGLSPSLSAISFVASPSIRKRRVSFCR